MKAITIWRARSSFRVGALSAAILLAATVFAEPVAAATISVLGSLPSNNPNDVFDVSQAGNSYGVGPGTTLNAAGYDVRDLFGGQFDPYVPERGGVVFGDNQAIGTVETVTVTLPQPVSIGSFDLILNEDGNNTGNRSTREFKLFSGAILIDDVFILNNSGTQSFTGAYGGNVLKQRHAFECSQ